MNNEIMSFSGKWIELETIILSERPNVTCFPSRVEFRPKMMMMVILLLLLLIIIMRHEHKGGLSGSKSIGEMRGNERVLRNEQN
jgi:hypothetical protein